MFVSLRGLVMCLFPVCIQQLCRWTSCTGYTRCFIFVSFLGIIVVVVVVVVVVAPVTVVDGQ